MSTIQINTQRPYMDALLERYRSALGKDFDRYRNHVYRTTTYAMHLLGGDTTHERLIETAFVYHDIALWTHKEMAYLEPSGALALNDNETHQWGLDPELLYDAIHWHHKITPYRGANATVIEACRKADWIDVSLGVINHGIHRADIATVKAAFPYLGFHKMLIGITKRNTGSYIAGSARVLKGIMKW